MKSETHQNLVAAFALPPNQPDAVDDAKRRFDTDATRWAELKGELRDAEEAAVVAVAEAVKASAAAYAESKPAVDVDLVEREHAARVAGLKATLSGLATRVDESGNDLAYAVERHRVEWLFALRPVEVDATAKLRQGLALALEALEELRPARGAVTWLASFDAGQATLAKQPQFAGGRLRVKGRRGMPLSGEFDPADLLAAVAQAAEPEEGPRTRTATPGESRFEPPVFASFQ